MVFNTDEGVRGETTAESLARLRPAFGADGTITAGSASQISDGACAVVVMSAEAAAARGAPVLAEIGAHGNVAGPDNSLQSQPSRAIRHALGKAGLGVDDLDLIEINEAFASVVLQSMRDLGVGPDKVNVNGGAIAVGHPIGASGARIALHLACELRRRGGGLGAAALCGGGGRAARYCCACRASMADPWPAVRQPCQPHTASGRSRRAERRMAPRCVPAGRLCWSRGQAPGPPCLPKSALCCPARLRHDQALC